MKPSSIGDQSDQFNRALAAGLAFFLGIIGGDLFYRRKFVEGFLVFGILILSYLISPVNSNVGGIARHVPTLLVVYGWVRAFLYVKSRGA